MTENKTFDPSGRAISYIDEGEGPVTLVLFSPASPEADGLGIIGHYLAEEAGFRVVRIGARAAGAVSAEERAQDAADILDALEISSTWIGGHGAGGTLARSFAVSHAERVDGLLIMGVEDVDVPLAGQIPVLIIQGADDDTTPPVVGVRLQQTAPERASVKTLDGAGHLFPVTHPIETAIIVEEYLDWD